jgi:hypothetical protein
LLGFGENDDTEMISLFKDVCSVTFNDGSIFDPERVSVARIREEMERDGLRITAKSRLMARGFRS